MRLIDANKLKPIEVYRGDVFCEMVFMGDIKNAPTVDAEPVLHGKWENTRPDAPMFGFYYCSKCGRKRTSPQDNYCPNCGAKMKE